MSLKQKKIQFKAKIKLNNNMLAKQLASWAQLFED